MNLDATNFCIVPFTHYTLSSSTLSTCCWSSKFCHLYFGHWLGPWQGKLEENAEFLKIAREQMYRLGAKKACEKANTCPQLKDLPSIREQFKRFQRDERSFCISSKVANDIIHNRAAISCGPIVLGISPSNRCNYDCKYCCVPREDLVEKTDPTDEEIDNLYPLYRDCVDFRTCGGDTFGLSDDRIEKFYGSMRGKKSTISVLTNGHGLTLRRYERFCANGPINHVMISLNGFDPDIYFDMHRRKIDQVINNIRQISSTYEKHCIGSLSYVITATNIDDGVNVIRFAEENRIPAVITRLVLPTYFARRGVEYLDPLGEGWSEEFYQSYLRLKEEVDVRKSSGPVQIRYFHLVERDVERERERRLNLSQS